MARISKTFRKPGGVFDSVAYSDDFGKVWCWAENNAIITVKTCAEYGIPCDKAAQQAAYDKHLDEFVAAYRANWKPPSGEQLAEMRAAFGPGADVVDVVSGHRFKV